MFSTGHSSQFFLNNWAYNFIKIPGETAHQGDGGVRAEHKLGGLAPVAGHEDAEVGSGRSEVNNKNDLAPAPLQ